jgi:hypothetical protein
MLFHTRKFLGSILAPDDMAIEIYTVLRGRSKQMQISTL